MTRKPVQLVFPWAPVAPVCRVSPLVEWLSEGHPLVPPDPDDPAFVRYGLGPVVEITRWP